MGRRQYLSEAPIEDTQVLPVKKIQVHIIPKLHLGWLSLCSVRLRCAHNSVHVLHKGVVPPEGALHLVHQSNHLAHLPALITDTDFTSQMLITRGQDDSSMQQLPQMCPPAVLAPVQKLQGCTLLLQAAGVHFRAEGQRGLSNLHSGHSGNNLVTLKQPSFWDSIV